MGAKPFQCSLPDGAMKKSGKPYFLFKRLKSLNLHKIRGLIINEQAYILCNTYKEKGLFNSENEPL